MIEGIEFHGIISTIFDGKVRGLYTSSQLQICCPECAEIEGVESDGKFNLELSTNPNKKIFSCWKCNYNGTLGALIYRFGTKEQYNEYKSYSLNLGEYDHEFDVDNDYGYEEPEAKVIKLPREFISFKDMDILNPDHIEAYNYMILDRKISRELLLRYKIGFSTTGRYEKRIILPSFDINGKLDYFIARNYDTANKNKKPYDNVKSDKNKIVFNEGFVNYDSTIYLVEGIFEMLSFPVNTIPMLGKTIGEALFMRLKELKPDVVILLDPDAYKNALNLFNQLQNIYGDETEKIKIVKLPNNDDLDELRRNYGHDEVIKCLRTARGLTIDDYFVNELSSSNERYNNRRSYNSKYFEWQKG